MTKCLQKLLLISSQHVFAKKIKNVCIALGLQELNGSGSQKLKKERLTALIRNMPHFEICT